MLFRKKHLAYITQLVNHKLPLTKSMNEAERAMLTNHRAISGINLKHKPFCYTPIVDQCSQAAISDIDGNHYLDVSMGFGVHMFGHHPNFIVEAIHKANEKPWGLGPISMSMFRLAKGIKTLTGVERMAFFNTGTEAIMVAQRLARAYTNKRKVVIFKGAFHGHNDGTLVFKTHPMTNQPLSLIPGVPESMQADTYLLEFNDEASLQFIQDHAHEIAAVLTEPVQSRNPACHPEQFLKQLRSLTQEHAIALIFDEMITGFRIHPGGAQGYFGIQADLVTYGKVIGGGMPIGIVAGKTVYLDMIDGGGWKYDDDSLPAIKRTFVAGTFCNHPLSMAAANAVVELLIDRGAEIINRLNQLTQNFTDDVNLWMQHEGIPIRLTNFGSLFRIEVPTVAKIFFHQLLLEGVYIWEGKTCFLSVAHSQEDVDELKVAIKKCALFLKACQYFPHPENAIGSKVLFPDLIVSCQKNFALNIACNIGVALKITGSHDPEFLEIAIRYVTLAEPNFRIRNMDACVFKQHVLPDELDQKLHEFINRDILDIGMAYLLLFQGATITHFALIGHKTKLDGWSISVLVGRIMQVYKALLTGKSLPYWGGQPNINISDQFVIVEDGHVSRLKKTSFQLAVNYSDLRKITKTWQVHPLVFFNAAFLWAYKKVIAMDQKSLILGNPVSGQLKYGCRNAIGPYTFMEGSFYTLDQLTCLEDCFQKGKYTQQRASCVVNIDRVVASPEDFDAMLSVPLDPDYIRYDIVLNILAQGKEKLWVDVKWRDENYTEANMAELIRVLKDIIEQHHASVRS